MSNRSILQIQLLGDFQLVYAGEPLRDVDSERLQALLAFLLLNADAPQSRHHIAYLFWPDSSEKQALANLRHVLFKLRKALPEPEQFLMVESKTLQWHVESSCEVDVFTFERRLAKGQAARRDSDRSIEVEALTDAIEHYTGDLFPACYEEWILPERDRLRRLWLASIERLIDLKLAGQNYTDAQAYAQQLLSYDPLHEAAYRHLMQIHALNGDRARALRVYHACVSTFARELSVEPSSATQELHARLLKFDSSEPAPTLPRIAETDYTLVGRTVEWHRLQKIAQTTLGTSAHRGQHIAFISGEAGIGKTRLAQELRWWAKSQAIPVAHTRAYEAEGRLAYAPVAEWLRSPTVRSAIDQLEETWQVEIARVLPELLTETPKLPPPAPMVENWQRLRLFEALSRAVHGAANPLLLILDDLQWCDQETLEWLHYLLRYDEKMRLLVVGTVRTEEIGPSHPLEIVETSLLRLGLGSEIHLAPLDSRAVGALAAQVMGHMPDETYTERLYQETEGYPLFVVELLRAGTQDSTTPSGNNKITSESIPPTTTPERTLPPRVYAIIERRLAQLTPTAQELTGLAAVVGRGFTVDILRLAGDREDMDVVQGIDELWQRRIIREQGSDAYDFSHDKIREVAYTQMSPSRRRLHHERVAAALEQQHAADLDDMHGQIAAHYAAADQNEEAIAYYMRAGEVARSLFANREALDYLQKGIDLAASLPDSPLRRQLEMDLHVMYGTILVAVKGYSDAQVNRVYSRALTLAEGQEDRVNMLLLLFGKWMYHATRGHLHEATVWANQMVKCVQTDRRYRSNAGLRMIAYSCKGAGMALSGQTRDALILVQKHDVLAPRAFRHDNERLPAQPPSFQAGFAHWLWHQGYVDQARMHNDKLLTLLRGNNDQFSLGFSIAYSAMLHQFLRRPQMVRVDAEEGLLLEVGPYYGSWLAMLHGWVRSVQGEVDAGRRELRQGLDEFTSIGGGLRLPYYWGLIAEAERCANDIPAALQAIDQGLAAAERTGQHFSSADLHRLRGELLQSAGDANSEGAAAASFQRALEIARDQSARIYELRAAICLAQLWQRHGKLEEAYETLSTVYGWFTEGFDIPDLQDARRLLQTLSFARP